MTNKKNKLKPSYNLWQISIQIRYHDDYKCVLRYYKTVPRAVAFEIKYIELSCFMPRDAFRVTAAKAHGAFPAKLYSKFSSTLRYTKIDNMQEG